MQTLQYGRKIFSFDEAGTALKSTVVTEKVLPGENEEGFIRRLSEKYQGQQGTIEVVFKRGLPDYAVISFSGNLEEVVDV
jgi:hypothetical protein